MPEITKDLREIAESREFSPKDGEDAIFFLKEVIREYDDDQLPVDAEWLDSIWLKGGSMFTWTKDNQLGYPAIFEWDYKKDALSTTRLQVRFVDRTEDYTESWAVYANTALLKSNPTRGDVRKMLGILGGGE